MLSIYSMKPEQCSLDSHPVNRKNFNETMSVADAAVNNWPCLFGTMVTEVQLVNWTQRNYVVIQKIYIVCTFHDQILNFLIAL